MTDWGSVIDGMGGAKPAEGSSVPDQQWEQHIAADQPTTLPEEPTLPPSAIAPAAQAPAGGAVAPANAPTPPAASPGAASGPWDAAVEAVSSAATQQAQAAVYAGTASNPDQTARALQLQAQTGVPYTIAQRDPARWERIAAAQAAAPVLKSDPALASWLLANPAAPALSHDDLPNLSLVGRLAAGFSTGSQEALLSNQLGRLRYADDPATAAQQTQIEQELAADQANLPKGFAAHASSVFGGIVAGLADQANQAKMAAVEGAGVGAGLGLPEAGVGAVPGAVAGAGLGLTAGMAVDGYRTGYGNTKAALASIPGLSPDTADFLAHGAGVALGALNLIGVKSIAAPVLREIAPLFTDGIAKAAQSPTVLQALGSLGINLAKSGATGAALGAANAAVPILAEQAARQLSDQNLPTILNDPAQRAQAIAQIASSAGDMALGMVGLHLLPMGAGFASDALAARQAPIDTANLTQLQDASAASKVRARSPDAFQSWIGSQTQGTPGENLFVPGDKVAQLYQDAGVAPGENDGIFGHFVPDIADQVQQAQATGGDVILPTAGYMTHVAATPLADALLPDIRSSADGMSMRDAAAFNAASDDLVRQQGEQAQSDYEAHKAAQAPALQIYDDVFSQARQAGFAPDVAAQYAGLATARAATRAARLGPDVDPLALHQDQGLSIQTELPESVRAAPADQMDVLLNALRSDKQGPNDAAVYGPSLMEFLARRGGVVDQGGDLAAMGADQWHAGQVGMPRFIRDAPEDAGEALPGMAQGDLPDNEYGEDASALAAHEAGYLPGADRPTIDDLHAALDQELRGQPAYAERNLNQSALSFRDTLADLDRTLTQIGVDPRTASNDEIRTALARAGTDAPGEAAGDDELWQGDQPPQPPQPGQAAPGEAAGPGAAPLASTPPAAEPVARISGDEIAPLDASTPDLRTAARSYYDQNLKGTSVRSDALKADVQFRSSDKTFSRAANNDKLRMFSALRDIVAHGELTKSEPPRDPAAESNTKAYHTLEAPVEVAGKPMRAAVSVREDNNGHIYYTHSAVDAAGDEVAPRDPLTSGSNTGLGDDGTTLFQQVGTADDGVNMTLHDAGNTGATGAAAIRAASVASKMEPRGSVTFRDGQTVVKLFGQRNLSTLLHEFGHIWRRELFQDAGRDDAPDQLRQDRDAVLKSFGVDRPDQITTEHEEQFARQAEAYLLEGKAPSEGLRGAFDRFRSWLTAIYRSARGLGVPMSDQMRGVFDRLLATDDEIASARERSGAEALFSNAADARMTDAEFQKYSEAVERARTGARDALADKAMSDVRRQREAWWKQEAAPIRDEVARDVDAQPHYAAMRLIRTGRLPGEDAADGPARRVRLSRDAIVDLMGDKSALDMLPRSVPPLYAKEGGLHPDMVADMVGADNGDALVRGLMGVEATRREMVARGDTRSPRTAEIEDAVKARMIDKHGDALSDGSVESEAMEAVHNERQLKLIGAELDALNRRPTGQNVRGERVWTGAATPVEVARRVAQRRIAEAPVREAGQVGQYVRAERKAQQATLAAVLHGDREEASRQTQRRLLNHALAIEAGKAAAEIDRGQRYLSRLGNAETLGTVAQKDLDQIHALLQRFDLSRQSPRALAKRDSLRSWIEGQREQGLEPAVPDKLADEAFTQHYTRLSMTDFRGLVDSVKSIEHLGRLRQKLLDAKEDREFGAEVDAAVQSAGAQRQVPVEAERNPTEAGTGLPEKLRAAVAITKHGLRAADASLLKTEQVALWLDGNEANGPWVRNVFRPLAEAQGRRSDMEAELAGKLRALDKTLPPEFSKGLGVRRSFPELTDKETGKPSSLLHSQLLAMALNLGNEGNMAKLLEGEGWSENGVRGALDRTLTEHDWKYVQGMLDIAESYWPDIAALQKRVSGVEPEKVEATPIPTRFGQLPGGYWPVMYDPLRAAADMRPKGDADALFGSNYTRATTAQGHTIARTNFSAPLHLSAEVAPRHFQQVIHDLSHREPVMGVNKFLSDRNVHRAVIGALGHEYAAQFGPWLRNVANERAFDPRGVAWWEKVAHTARTNATVMGLGFRASTAIIHGTTAAMNSVAEVGAKDLASAVGTFLRDPRGTLQFVMDKSAVLRNRMDNMDRDMRATLQDLQGKTGGLATVRRFSMMAVAHLDLASALPTWQAGYVKGLRDGMTDADAVYAGDQAVRLAHGAGGAADLSAIQRPGSETMKLFTLFYSFWNHLYNRQRTVIRDAQNISSTRDFASVLARSFFYVAAPPIIHGLISGGGGGPSQQETWLGWSARHIGFGLLGGLPVLRDIGSAVETGRTYSATPIADEGEAIAATLRDAGRAMGMLDGEPSDHWAQHAAKAGGYLTGLPLGQGLATGKFLWDVMDGDQSPQGVAEWWRGVMTGKSEVVRRI